MEVHRDRIRVTGIENGAALIRTVARPECARSRRQRVANAIEPSVQRAQTVFSRRNLPTDQNIARPMSI